MRTKVGGEEVKGAALFLGRPTEWVRTVICETAPFDLGTSTMAMFMPEPEDTRIFGKCKFFSKHP